MTPGELQDERRARDAARKKGSALEAMFRFIVWLVPTLDRFPPQPEIPSPRPR